MPFKPGTSGNIKGRPKGISDRRIAQREQAMATRVAAMAEITARLGYDPDNGPQFDAHTFLCATYRHPELPLDVRLEAARAAIRYEKPALQASTVNGDVHHHISIADQLQRARRRVTAGGPVIDASEMALEEAARELVDGAAE